VQLAQDWSLQPDLQYIIHAGGHALNPLAPSVSPIPNATVIGARTILKF
jgi:porin